jgi:hypothetical protein
MKDITDGHSMLAMFLSPIDSAKSALNKSKFEHRASSFVDAMTDGKWSAEMMKLKEMNPSDSASARALVQLLGRIGTDGLDDESFDFTPKEQDIQLGGEQ